MLNRNLTGALLRDPCPVREKDIAAIGNLPNPPLVPLKAEDIHVRRCRLANDQVDSRYGRFHTGDLPRLLELVRGAPVLIGHDHRSLGVARFFDGEVEQRGEESWVVPKFYWPRAHSRAEDLRVMIDSGVYSEASIAFLYRRPTCSICGEDIRQCPHWPGRAYGGETCFYWYDGLEQVTEGSLVYRGAATGTGFELDCGTKDEDNNEERQTVREMVIKHRGRRYTAQLLPLAKKDM